MKYLLPLILLFASFYAFAEPPSGSYYNPDRDGEGLIVYVRDSTLVFYFFTYYDRFTSVEPTVSPAPPDPVEISCKNEGVWFIGIAQDWDGQGASGDVLLARALDYPNVDPITNQLQAMIKIGGFTATAQEGGFDLIVTSTGYFPSTMYLFNNVFHFHKLVIE